MIKYVFHRNNWYFVDYSIIFGYVELEAFIPNRKYKYDEKHYSNYFYVFTRL